MSRRYFYILGIFSVFLCIFPFLYEIYEYSLPSNISSWQVTEWLISYQGGFVRRGLPGQFLEIFCNYYNVNPSIVIVVLSAAFFVVFALSAFITCRGCVPIFLLFSPILIGMPVFGDFVVRKDIITILCFMICMEVIFSALADRVKFVLVNMVSIFALLSHEAYLFSCMLMLIFTYSYVRYEGLYIKKGLLFLLPSIVCAVAVLISKGNAEVAQRITETWNATLSQVAPDYCCFTEPPAAIRAIGWSTIHGLRLSFRVLGHFSGPFWVPLIWAGSLFFSAFAICVLKKKDDFESRSFFMRIYEIQTLSSLPLFVAGWDFGRWIFLISMSSVITCAMWENRPEMARPILRTRWLPVFYPRGGRAMPVIVSFLVAIPPCCWSFVGYFRGTPIVSSIRALERLVPLLF